MDATQQRLLIVEDDVHMAYLLGYLAEKERFAVESIADGRKAVERIERGDAVDLVLLDVMLPYMDGFELLEKLRSHDAWKQVPVIILTSRTREHDAVRALGLGADDYLTEALQPSRARRAHPSPHRAGEGAMKTARELLKGTVPFIFAGLLMTSTAFACDVALEATVAAKPDDTDARDALARSCAQAGRQADALAHYDVLLTHDSNNVDWLLGKSQALVALRRPREALPLLEKGRSLAPAYEDVWRLNASALDQLDEFDAADALLTQAAAQFPQATWPRERKIALDERRVLERGNRLSADVSYEDLSGGRDPWKGASIGLDHSLGASRHLFAGLHYEERFDARDEQLLLGYADRLNDDWSYGVSADLSPDAVNLPRWSFTAESGRRLPDAWSLGFRLRHASHANTDVDSISASAEKYFDWLSLGSLDDTDLDKAIPTSPTRISATCSAPRTTTAGSRVSSSSASARKRNRRPGGR